MQTIQVVLDEDLLQAADRAARLEQINRSALMREALRAYLRHLKIKQAEERDREGYKRFPDSADDLAMWEKVAAWPES